MKTACVATACLALITLIGEPVLATDRLQNDRLRVEFGERGLVSIRDQATRKTVRFARDGFSVLVGDDCLDSDFLQPTAAQTGQSSRTYTFASGPWTVTVVYELKPGWRFVSKQLWVSTKTAKDFQVRRMEPFRGQVTDPVAEEQDTRSAALLRLGPGQGRKPAHGVFLALQNPFLQWKREAGRLSAAYVVDMPWRSALGPFASDRLCIGPYALSGARYPVQMVPEWKFNPAPAPAAAAAIDVNEEEALTDCARAFLLDHPQQTLRVHVGWCENDYQIDVATPEGRDEYRRIIDQAAALGCRNLLFAPGNRELSSLSENRDAWGWENILWLGLGQRIRKGEWDPAADRVPASVQGLIDYAGERGVKFLAYVYPSLPFLQNPEWTQWIKGTPRGYQGADTGLRDFQDWLLDKLIAFHAKAGVNGYAFDHWWIAYDHASSKYAQWHGCRRILETLRKRVPDIVIDGRQQYQYFGVWTWLAGSYPHPLSTDEQPQSFRAFPDLHLDRVSADRQRFTAWWYRMTQFCPPEILPGFITHQTPRSDEHDVMHRDRFRPRDWDYLGWRYSLMSAIGTAPFNHVVNMVPARDIDEATYFSDADKKWFRGWLDWTDRNLAVLRHLRPILGQPMLGRVDGTAAFEGDHGFVFLFNPNYRSLPVAFSLDATIGLPRGKHFLLRQVYPDDEKGRLIPGGGKGWWRYGEHVTLSLPGTEALVLEVGPAPERLQEPVLLGALGHATVSGGELALTDVAGPIGANRDLVVRVPDKSKIRALTVNGKGVEFKQAGDSVSFRVRFGGTPFSRCPQIGQYDAEFAGRAYRAETRIPARVWEQLRRRREQWPVRYTEDDLRATWLGPDRLLLFVNVAEPSDKMEIAVKIDGDPVSLQRAYSSVYPQAVERTFVGWYADVSALKPDVTHRFELALPVLAAGQFQGLFLDNVEAEITREISDSAGRTERDATGR